MSWVLDRGYLGRVLGNCFVAMVISRIAMVVASPSSVLFHPEGGQTLTWQLGTLPLQTFRTNHFANLPSIGRMLLASVSLHVFGGHFE